MSGRDPRRFRLDVGRGRVERELDAELEFHLAMRAERLAASGLDAREARAQAQRQFGDLRAVRAECLVIDRARERDMRRTIRLADLRQDASYAVRSLRARPGYVATLLLILALGIGANVATFSIVDALLLRPIPVPHPEQLVTIGDPTRTGAMSEGSPNTQLASYPLYLDVRDHNRVLSGVYATGRTGRLDVLVPGARGGTSGAEPEHPRGRYVSGSYWQVLGVPAYLGRTFGSSEDRVAGGAPVTVISHGCWRRRFGADPAIVGRTLTVNGTPLTIVGIAPPGFVGDLVGQRIDLWIPVTMQPALAPQRPWLDDRSTNWLLMMGRLAPGVTLPRARAELTAVLTHSLLEHATGEQQGSVQRGLREQPVRVEAGARGFSYYRHAYASALLVLSAAVGLVLLVVCANVANLLLARSAARGREISVRMAIGAGRRRLVQQLLVESAVVATAGGVLGLVVAWWGSRALLRLAAPSGEPLPLDARLDTRVLAFTAAVSLGTALLFGLAPSIHATRVELATALRTQGRGVAGTGHRPERLPLGKLLVVAQVALSLLLLVGTGVLVRSLQRLDEVDLGLARDELIIAEVDVERSGYPRERAAEVAATLVERARRLPGVTGATFSENGIFSGVESHATIQVEGFTARADADSLVAYDDVGPEYFRTIGARVLRGRDFLAGDAAASSKVAVVNETLARFYFGGGDAVGRRLSLDGVDYEIAGVVEDVQGHGLRDEPVRRVYFAMAQLPADQRPGQVRLVVRVRGDPARLVVPLRRALLGAGSSLVVLSVEPLSDLVRETMSQDRLVARVVTFFGILALVLATLGLYGVIAYATIRRTNEFGLRLALGAHASDVVRMVVGEALRLLGVGVAIGVPAAVAGTYVLRNRLFGIDAMDAPSLAASVGALAVAAVLASAIPALRAARVAPTEALRAD